MAIPVEQVKLLRDETGFSMGNCMQALQDAKGDMELAKVYLKTKFYGYLDFPNGPHQPG